MGPRTWRTGAMAWTAGAVDAYAYLLLGNVFVSHVTGNTARFAIALVQRHFGEAFERGMALPLFFGGGMAGAALVDSADDPRQVARAVLVEVGLLVCSVLLVWTTREPLYSSRGIWTLLLALLAGAMGIQNAALTHPGVRGTHTTHITGTLTDVATDVVRLIIPARRREFEASRLARLVARVVGFGVGALSGALLYGALPVTAPLIPAAVLLVIAVADLILCAPVQD